MNYSLSQSLSRSGAINPDGLSLDLAFAADKTLTARKGPTPTFTRASTATFVGSDGLIQSAAINEARFDHDPVTLACKGLLIEEARTNALQHSSNFKNTTSSNYWQNLSATTVTVDQIASPDGGLNADLLATSTASFDCFTRRVGIFAGSTQYTYSIFLKQGPSGYRYVGLYIGVGINSTKFPFFDFNNPTTVQIPSGTMVGTIDSTRVDAYPDGWYRVSVAFTTAATPVTALCGVYISQSDGNLPGSSVAGLDAYIWGIQLEAGSFPTSYIPTTTAALTRSADVCSVTTAGWSNAGNDTMLAEYFDSTVTSGAVIVEGSPAISWMSLLFGSPNKQRNIYRHGGTSTRFDATTANNSVSLININKTALTSGEQLALNGSLTQTVAFDPPQADISTSLSIGSRGNGASLFFNGHIARIKYFRKRLANAKLQTLTQLVSDADANAYITSLLSVGAAVTLTQQDAINTFVKAGKADGWWSSLKRLYLPIWASAAPNAVDMITRASGTFNGTVTHGAGYVQGDGSTGYFDIGLTPSALGLTTTEAGFFALVNQAGSSGSRSYLSCSDNASNTIYCGLATTSSGSVLQSSFGSISDASAFVNVALTHQATNGVIAGFKSGGTAFIQRRLSSGNSTLVSETEGGAGTIPTVRNLYALAFNYNGTPVAFTDARLGSYGVSGGMSSANVTAYTLALKNLWETCTGLTLP